MDIRTPHIRTPYIGTPSIKAQSVGASLVTGATKDVIATPIIALTGNSVTITCATTGATIYYTLDGSTPTSSSSQYSSAFTLDSSCTIKAIAIKGGKSSAVAEESYVKPITYLTQWQIVGNSEVHGNEIWSCGEYNPTDGKYHILVQPLGGSIADIALTEPLRMVNSVADTVEFPSETEGKALVTRKLTAITTNLTARQMDSQTKVCLTNQVFTDGVSYIGNVETGNILCDKISTSKGLNYSRSYEGICFSLYSNNIWIRNGEIEQTTTAYQNFFNELGSLYIIYELNTPTTELVDAPQMAEAESYTCVINQGGKAVEWSSFSTD